MTLDQAVHCPECPMLELASASRGKGQWQPRETALDILVGPIVFEPRLVF